MAMPAASAPPALPNPQPDPLPPVDDGPPPVPPPVAAVVPLPLPLVPLPLVPLPLVPLPLVPPVGVGRSVATSTSSNSTVSSLVGAQSLPDPPKKVLKYSW